MTETRPKLLTVDEVAKWLSVSPAWVYDHLERRSPTLACVRLGGSVRFRPEDVEQYIAENLTSKGQRRSA